MITAEADREKVVAAVKAGVNNYILKPFTTESLEQKLQQVYRHLPAGAA